jgi:hypothetical protein
MPKLVIIGQKWKKSNTMTESQEKKPVKKRESGITRIVGLNPKDEEIMLGVFSKAFSSQEKPSFEKEKPKELKIMIEKLNKYLNEFSLKYRAKPLDIKPDNIHLLDWEKMDDEQKIFFQSKFKDYVGSFDMDGQGILIFQRPGWSDSLLGMAKVISHEMLHGLAFQSLGLRPYNAEIDFSELGVEKDDNEGGGRFTLIPRRGGFRIIKNEIRNGKVEEIELFALLDECIISELAYRFDRQYFGMISEIAESTEFKNREEFYKQKAGEEESRRHDYALVTEVKRYKDGKTSFLEFIAKKSEYLKERRKLDKLIDELFEKNKDEFKDREEVFDIFARAVMTGRLLPVARLIEKTFGKGSFRELGEESAKKAS